MGAHNLVSRPQSLLTTKLIAAQFNPRFVSRMGLFADLLDKRKGGRVLSIVATAGSGKSTLMAELHHTCQALDVATCWLSLDHDDNRPASFATYFVSALQATVPELVPGVIDLLRGNQVSNWDALFDQIVAQIANVALELAIFLDDFQHITHPAILRFINRLATHLPSYVRLVIASRASLALDLGRLRVRHLLLEVEQEALNLDKTTTAQLLQQVHGIALSSEDLAALVAMTEGWVTAIQLAALALHRRQGSARELIDSFSGRDRHLTDYLVESVLDSQSSQVRAFLLATSPLRRMSAPLCDAITGTGPSDALISHLQAQRLFVIPLDHAGYWYRYHHLFAECLQKEFKRASPEKYRQVCELAAVWCESNGHITEAIQYWLDCEQFEQASQLIAIHALSVAQKNGDHYTVLDWMRRLPARYQESHPEILLSHAWSMAFSQHGHEAMALAKQVIERLDVSNSEDGSGWQLTAQGKRQLRFVARVTQAVAEATADQLDDCLIHAEELSTQLPSTELFLMAAVRNCISYCYFAKREFNKSVHAAADAYLYGQRCSAGFAVAWADFLHGLADLELGKIHSAREHSQRMLLSSQHGGAAQSYSAGLAALLDAEIAMQTCDFDRLEQPPEDSHFFTKVFGPVEPLLLSIRHQARAHAHRRQWTQAKQTVMNGQDLALKLNLPRLFVSLAIEEVDVRLQSGDLGGALSAAQRTGLRREQPAAADTTNAGLAVDHLGDVMLLLEVRVLLAQGKAAAVLRHLVFFHNRHNANPSPSTRLTLLALKAVALWRCERRTEAVRELDHALAQASQECQVYSLYRIGADLLPILQAIAQQRPNRVTVQVVQAKVKLEYDLHRLLSDEAQPRLATLPSPNVDTAPVSSVLTEREIELLRLVDAGLSNQQAANELLISEPTVKWHLHNIYTKMGIRSRGSAAARARALKLI